MNDALHWLYQTNPTVVLPFVGGLLAWLWHKVTGQKTANFTDIINAAMANMMNEWLDKYKKSDVKPDLKNYVAQARAYIESKIWDVLTKRGVPKNSLTTPLVHAAVENATLWLGNRIAELSLPAQLDAALARLKATQDILGGVNPPAGA